MRRERRALFWWLGTVPELQIGPPGDPWWCANSAGEVVQRADQPTATHAVRTALGAYLFADTPDAQLARAWCQRWEVDPDQLKYLSSCVYTALTDGLQAVPRKEPIP